MTMTTVTAPATGRARPAAPPPVPASPARWRARVPRIFSIALGLTALLCTVAAISGAWRSGTQPVRQLIDTLLIPAPSNLAYAAFVGVLAAATARRKRVAFAVLVGYFALSLVANGTGAGLIAFVSEADLRDDA